MLNSTKYSEFWNVRIKKKKKEEGEKRKVTGEQIRKCLLRIKF